MTRSSGSTSVLPMPHRISFTKRSPTPTNSNNNAAPAMSPSPSPTPTPSASKSTSFVSSAASPRATPSSTPTRNNTSSSPTAQSSSSAAPPSSSTPSSSPSSSSTFDASSMFSGAWLTPVHPNSRSVPTYSPTVYTPGMSNLGNTCFMNAALQCLLHCQPLASLLIRSEPHANHLSSSLPSSSSNRSSGRFNNNQHRFCTFCALQALARDAYRRDPPRVLSPTSLARNTRSICSSFRQGRQEDSHEFIRALMDAMVRAEVRGCGAMQPVRWHLEAKTDIHRIFGGALQSSVTCKQCDHASTTSEPFLDLSLEITKSLSVKHALSKFTAPEYLEGDNRYRCSACKKLVVAEKRLTLRRAPNVLTLHLKRFDRVKKDNRFVEFPEKLDLARYMYGKPGNVGVNYELTGVVVHQGMSKSYGHYHAFVKTADGKWANKDDSSSRPSSLGTVLKTRAYVMFYSRVDNPPTNDTRAPSTPSSQEKKSPPSQDDYEFLHTPPSTPKRNNSASSSLHIPNKTAPMNGINRTPRNYSGPLSPASNVSTPIASHTQRANSVGSPDNHTSPITPLRFGSPSSSLGAKSPKVSIQTQNHASVPTSPKSLNKASLPPRHPINSPANGKKSSNKSASLIPTSPSNTNATNLSKSPSPSHTPSPSPAPRLNNNNDDEMLELSSESESEDERPLARQSPSSRQSQSRTKDAENIFVPPPTMVTDKAKNSTAHLTPSNMTNTPVKGVSPVVTDVSFFDKRNNQVSKSTVNTTISSITPVKKVLKGNDGDRKHVCPSSNVKLNKSGASASSQAEQSILSSSLIDNNKLSPLVKPKPQQQGSGSGSQPDIKLPNSRSPSNVKLANSPSFITPKVNKPQQQPANGLASQPNMNTKQSTPSSPVASPKRSNGANSSCSSSAAKDGNVTTSVATGPRKILISGSETARKKVQNAFRRAESSGSASGEVSSKRVLSPYSAGGDGEKRSKRGVTANTNNADGTTNGNSGSSKLERKRSFHCPSEKVGEVLEGQTATKTPEADNNKKVKGVNRCASNIQSGHLANDVPLSKNQNGIAGTVSGAPSNASSSVGYVKAKDAVVGVNGIGKDKMRNGGSAPPVVNGGGNLGPATKITGSSQLFGSQGVDQWDVNVNDNTNGSGQVRRYEQEHQQLATNTNSSGNNAQKSRPKISKRRRANDELDAEYDRGRLRKVRSRGGSGSSDAANGRNCFDVASERRRHQHNSFPPPSPGFDGNEMNGSTS